jgi:hypothetical protein
MLNKFIYFACFAIIGMAVLAFLPVFLFMAATAAAVTGLLLLL